MKKIAQCTRSKLIANRLIRYGQSVGTSQSRLKSSDRGRISKRDANKFLLGSILDYQIPGELAWNNALRLAEEILGDPDDLWERIASMTETQWKSKWRKYKLHRFPAAHFRIWRIGKEIVANYHGDAREIWENQNSDAVLRRLGDLKVGKQLSRMIVGSLIDTGHIRGSGDVKVDRHIRRTLGRMLIGRGYMEHEADKVTIATRQMRPSNPWILDWPLFVLGSTVCTTNDPHCTICDFKTYCCFFANHNKQPVRLSKY